MDKIFFTAPAPSNVSPSPLFKEHGNNTDVPTVPSEMHVAPLPNDTDLEPLLMFKEFFYAIVAARTSEETGRLKAFYSIDREIKTDFFRDLPRVGVTFAAQNAEATGRLYERLGLVREVVGRQTFYKGTLQKDGAREVLLNGGNPEAYIPYGVTNIAGLLTFYELRRLLFFVIRSVPAKLSEDNIRKLVSFAENAISIGVLDKKDYTDYYTLAREFSAKRGGHCCPYYEGMSLPDKFIVPNILANLGLNRLLGADSAAVENAVLSIRKGWKSLCHTQQGMALAHAWKSVEVAISGGLRPHLLFNSSGTYVGSCLIGKASVVKNADVYKPHKFADLRNLAHSLDTHNTGLITLRNLLRDLNVKVDDEPVDINHLSSPRAIYRIIVSANIPTASRVQFREAVRLLDFPQTFWTVKDQKRLEITFSRLIKLEEPPISDPFPYKTELLFSSDIYQSILGVYGDKAPSLSLPSGNTVVVIKSSKARRPGDDKSTENFAKEGGLTHMPVYALAVQQAALAWRRVVTNKTITIKARNKRPEGAMTMYPVDLAMGQYLQGVLVRATRQRKEQTEASGSTKKRSAEDTDEVTRLAKKLRKHGASADQFAAFLAWQSGQREAQEESDEEMVE